MLSRLHLIPERYGRTDRRTDGQICYINIAHQHTSTLQSRHYYVVSCNYWWQILQFLSHTDCQDASCQKMWKVVKICRSYGQNTIGTYFPDTVYNECTVGVHKIKYVPKVYRHVIKNVTTLEWRRADEVNRDKINSSALITLINFMQHIIFITLHYINQLQNQIDSAFYPPWDGKMSISFRAE